MKKARILLFSPGAHPKASRIPLDAESMLAVLKDSNKNCCGAHALKMKKNIYLVYPKLEDVLECDGTRKYCDDVICGTFAIVKLDDSGNLISMDYPCPLSTSDAADEEVRL